MKQWHRTGRVLVAGAAVLSVGAVMTTAAGATPAPDRHVTAHAAKLTVVGKNLNNPRKLKFGTDGALYVTEAGKGGNGACAPSPEDPTAKQCVGLTGSVTRLLNHTQKRVVKNLPSVAGADGSGATGPADVLQAGNHLEVLVQDANTTVTGGNPFGTAGKLLGQLLRTSLSGKIQHVGPDFGKYEAKKNPDHGAGAQPGNEIDSDPYAIVQYKGGYAVADAAGNDLLFVTKSGKVSTLAVFPPQMVPAPPGIPGGPPAGTPIPVQSVPTSVVVGLDGALYVGELTGFPFIKGLARIWQVVPGRAPKVVAKGFTNIVDLALDGTKGLLVLEIAKNGLLAPNGPGALILFGKNGKRTELASAGLVTPTGVAVSKTGQIYVSNYGTFPGSGPGPHGQVVRVG